MAQAKQNLGYRLVKLDRRMAGHDIFTHRVVFSNSLIHVVGYKQAEKIMFEQRNWCWESQRNWCLESFGPSMELEMLTLFKTPRDLRDDVYDPNWAWEYTGTRTAIYLKDSALTAWQLKFL